MKLIQVFICHVSFVSVSKFVFACPEHNLTDVNNVVTYQYQGRRPRFTQKEKFSSIVSGDISEGAAKIRTKRKVLLNYKWSGSGRQRKGCSSTHIDVGLIFVWKQAGTPRAKVNLVNV